MQLLRWNNPGHETTRASSMLRGAGCREPNPRLRRREKNVLDIPLYRPGHSAQNPPKPYSPTARPLPLLASPRGFAVVPILRHGRPSPWANTESSRITVAECLGFQTWIIVNWRYSTASAQQPRAAFTSTPLISSLLGIAPSPASLSTASL